MMHPLIVLNAVYEMESNKLFWPYIYDKRSWYKRYNNIV